MSKPKVAFICVHNSCRSQIAEAFGKVLAADVFESYSAGTETKPQINQDAVRLMKELYGIDMEKTQYSKLISAIPKPDIAISMGCNVSCPFIGRPFDENWGLDDPTGKSDNEFKAVIEQIRQNVLALKSKLYDGSSFETLKNMVLITQLDSCYTKATLSFQIQNRKRRIANGYHKKITHRPPAFCHFSERPHFFP